MQALPSGAAARLGWLCAAAMVIGLTPATVTPALAASSSLATVGTAPRVPPGARTVGAPAGNTRMSILVALAPRNAAALASYATDVGTPGTSVYRHDLTVAGFRARFGPTAARTSAVEAALTASGLRAGPVSSNGLLIAVTATAAQLEKAFSVSFRSEALPGGRIAFANAQAPRFDASVAGAIQGVIGLDNLQVAYPLGLVRAPRHAGAIATLPSAGGPQPCPAAMQAARATGAYTADQLAGAYGFTSLYGAGDLGAGQTVALFELEPNSPADIAAYQSCYGTSAGVNYLNVDGGAGAGPGKGEAALDIEDVIGLAPQATIDVYQAPNNGAIAWIDNWTAVVTSGATVASTSWGACEANAATINAENTLFQEAATSGETIYAAAGDNGSEDCSAHGGSQALAVDDPGTQPFVTSVGGTSLQLSPSLHEVVWNDGSPMGAGGGGISSVWTMRLFQSAMPAWINVINANSSATPCRAPSGSFCREVPDVSADADPNTGYTINWKGIWGGVGGTSAAAPLWAAFTALANASSACHGAKIGYANPVLYRAAASDYAANFNDVTSGNNDFTGTNHGLYPAGPGYDMASGLGTPSGASLAPALCAGGGNLVTFTGPGNQSSPVGTATSLQIHATDTAGATLTYSATGLPAGLTISSSTGLISGTPTATGTSSVTVRAVDTSGAYDQTAFAWTVTLGQPVSFTATVRDSATRRRWTGTERAGATAYAGAVVTGRSGVATGTVTYSFWGNGTCASAPTTSRTVRIAAGGVVPVSPRTRPLAAGSDSFRATYSGDATYVAAGTGCRAFAVRTGLADLRIAIHGPAGVTPGSVFSERVTVTNAGPSPATGVITAVVAPRGLRIVKAHGAHESGSFLVWTDRSLAAGAHAGYTVSFRVSATAAGEASFAAGTASTQVQDPRYANNAVAVNVLLGSARSPSRRPRDPFALGARIVHRLKRLI